MDHKAVRSSSDWPTATGETAALVRRLDWNGTGMGPVASWSPRLLAAADMVLRSPMAMALFWGRAGCLVYNDAYAMIAGERHPRILGVSVLDAWPEARDFNAHVLETVLGGDTVSLRQGHFVLQRQGRPEDAWFDLDFSPVPDETGEPAGVLAVVAETTRHVRVAERLRIAQEAGGVGTFEWYPGTGRLEGPGEYRRLWGLGPDEEITQERLLDLVHPGDRHLTGPNRAGDTNPLTYAEYRINRADTGEERTLARRGEVVMTAGGEWRFVGVLMDVTERCRAEAALRASEQRWRHLFERMREGLYVGEAILGADGRMCDYRFVEVTPAYETLTGTPVSRVLGNTLREAVPHLPRAAFERYADVIATGVSTEFELEMPPESGRWFQNRAYRIASDRFAVQILDITERKHAEGALRELNATLGARVRAEVEAREGVQEALRQSQKMEAVGQLTGGIAHDFNNLLQGIGGSLELMQRRLAQGRFGELDRYLAGASRSVGRAAALTHRLLAFSRRQPLDPKPVEVNPLLASMQDLLERTLGRSIELAWHLATEPPVAFCDAHQLEGAVLNLALNARDAMATGGMLSIGSAERWLDAGPEAAAGRYVCVEVADTGTGMPADILARAFEPFFTTKPTGQGTGLGLSMIYGFARQSGGHVTLDSEPGRGTTVRLYLPPGTRGMGGAEPESTPLLSAAASGGTILVVEDEADIRGMVAEALRELGYTVVEASDGAAGLAVLDGGRPIDLVVSDVGMPGMDGHAMVAAMRRSHPGLPVLFVTGLAEEAALGPGAGLPGAEVLAKPFTMEALAARVGAMMAVEDGPDHDTAT